MHIKYLLLIAISMVNALPTNNTSPDGIRKQAWIGSTNCDEDLRKITCIKKDGRKAQTVYKNTKFYYRDESDKPRSSICDISYCRKCINSDGDNRSDCNDCADVLYHTTSLFKGYACMRLDVDIAGPDFSLIPNEWVYPNNY